MKAVKAMLSMTKFEVKKLIKNKSTMGAIIVALVLFYGIFFIFFLQSQLVGSSKDPIHGQKAISLNNKIANSYSGPLTDKRINDIIDYRVRTFNKANSAKNNFFMDVFGWSVANKFISEEDQGKFYTVNGADRTGIRVIPVNSLGTKFAPSEIKIGNFKTWNELFRVLTSSFILIAVLTIYICSSIFSGDFSKNIMPLLLTTKYGRTKQTHAKMFAVFCISTTIFIVAQLITVIFFGLYFGFSGWDTSVQFNLEWNIFPFPLKMNFLQLSIWILIIQYLGLLFTAFITALISSYTPNPFISLAVSLLVFSLPVLLEKIFKSGIFYKLLWLFPVIDSNVAKMMEHLVNPQNNFLFNSIPINITAIILFFVAVIIASFRIIYIRIRTMK